MSDIPVVDLTSPVRPSVIVFAGKSADWPTPAEAADVRTPKPTSPSKKGKAKWAPLAPKRKRAAVSPTKTPGKTPSKSPAAKRTDVKDTPAKDPPAVRPGVERAKRSLFDAISEGRVYEGRQPRWSVDTSDEEEAPSLTPLKIKEDTSEVVKPAPVKARGRRIWELKAQYAQVKRETEELKARSFVKGSQESPEEREMRREAIARARDEGDDEGQLAIYDSEFDD